MSSNPNNNVFCYYFNVMAITINWVRITFTCSPIPIRIDLNKINNALRQINVEENRKLVELLMNIQCLCLTDDSENWCSTMF